MKYKLINKTNKECNVIEQILYNRQIQNIQDFLNPPDSCIHNPQELDNISIAAQMLLTSIVLNEKIHIQVDSDCDGYTSAAILINYLHLTFPSLVENNITYALHDSKYHGINLHTIPNDTKLVVAPDSSSNEEFLHQELNKKGIKVLVLDHHQAVKEKRNDLTIIVNNQLCDYENKYLSGAGIVYKFCKFLDTILKINYADYFLDLAGLGMCADMMDLRSLETKKLMYDGFANIQNLFFKEMIQKQEFSMKGQVTPFTVGWYVAPYINAICRSGDLNDKLLLFESMLDFKAEKLVPSTKRGAKGQEERLVDQAIRVSANVKARQDESKRQILDVVRSKVTDDPVVVIKLEEPIDSNLNGLVANEIMHEIKRPVFILNKFEQESIIVDGTYKDYQETVEKHINWRGSARGIATEEINDWRTFVESSGFAVYAEGHPLAFGVSFLDEDLDNFIAFTKERFPQKKFESYYDVDFIWDNVEDKNFDDLIKCIGCYNHIWGQNVEEPYVVIKNIKVTKKTLILMNKGAMKILVPGHITNCIKFHSENLYNDLLNYLTTDDSNLNITIIGRCAINEWQGNITP